MFGHFSRLIISLLVCISLTGCAAAIIGGAPGGYRSNAGQSPAGAASSDAVITSSINSRFVQDAQVSAMDINVSTHRGTVTLSGRVNNDAAARRAVAIARATQGVSRVVSRIIVVSH